jgi:NAD(P)-dependent dehydrogenase (short-subunit alcohol dehydrogenase family)
MPTLDFTNRLIVITGVGRAGQVGEALALGFAQRGATLALLDRDEAQVQARAAELAAQGFTASAHVANLADAASAEEAAQAVLAAHNAKAVHAVVCTAGGFGFTGPVSNADPADWAKQFTINLETAFATTRAFLPALREAKGSLVYFGSVAALGTPRAWPPTPSPKAGCSPSCAPWPPMKRATVSAPTPSPPPPSAPPPTSPTWATRPTTWSARASPTWWRFWPATSRGT